MHKLLPCPFCGGRACIETHSFYDERTKGFDDHSYGVVCENCNAQTAQFYLTKAQAKGAWNARYNDIKFVLTAEDVENYRIPENALTKERMEHLYYISSDGKETKAFIFKKEQ